MSRVIEYIKRTQQSSAKPFCAYLYDLDHLRSHVASRAESLPAACQLFYAIKANSEPQILRALLPYVRGFEVASLGEVDKVRAVSADVPILFGGPGKTNEEIEGAIRQRVSLIHVESLNELRRVDVLARKHGVTVPILLRVNLRGPFPSATLAMAGRPTQFGIDESLVPEAIRLALALEGVKLQGFHFHSLSNNLDAGKHVELVAYYLQIVAKWQALFDLDISYLNAGGGIGVNYADLQQQFDWPAFVQGLSALLDSAALPVRHVLFECGRYLTAASGYYAAEVLDIKQNHGKTYAIIRGGTHQFRLPSSWQHSHPFTVIPTEKWEYPYERTRHENGPLTVVGQLCTPKDVLASDVFVPSLRVGDIICFQYAGAYGWAISHHDFLSHPHPDHIYVEQAGILA
ncbi:MULTISPECIES: type III PLP-dependent enzyme [Brevibacillus]|uniref:type III PLP-dependent enzyme n=1 Tax=Brevibacillus TaxID=55080 RepID=UPI0004246F2B|nr:MULTISPECIES: type III PLP-dependent enzyme [Brevibacillus]QHZ56640.1 type III PLP-dependent enzyme [Brevibacillus sp. NSP2.1]